MAVKSGRCGREGSKGEDKVTRKAIGSSVRAVVVGTEKGGSEMLTVTCFSRGGSLKFSFFFTTVHREKKLQYYL